MSVEGFRSLLVGTIAGKEGRQEEHVGKILLALVIIYACMHEFLWFLFWKVMLCISLLYLSNICLHCCCFTVFSISLC